MRLVEALGSALARSGCDHRSDAEKTKALTAWAESHPELADLDPVELSPDQWDAIVGPPVVPAGRGWSGRADQMRELALACALFEEPDPTRVGLTGRHQENASGVAQSEGGTDGSNHSCVPCAVASSEGWWGRSLPLRFTHCRDCHTSFPGSNRFGHCSRCHQSFSGLDAFDSHQRTSDGGDFTPDCLCSTYRDADGKGSTDDVRSERSWKVSAAVVLVLHDATWGLFWSRDRDLAGVFGGGP